MLGNEPFYFFFADDFFTGDVSTASQMLKVYEQTGKSVVALRKVPDEEVSSYGVANVIESLDNGVVKVAGITEKPELAEAPSNLAVGSGYLLTPDILPVLEREEPGPDGELRINDAFTELAQIAPLYGIEIDGEYHDTGNPESYIKTLIEIALKDERYGDAIHSYLKTIM
jgi:UTP--glucose-1-phosphate uridylyltransferase